MINGPEGLLPKGRTFSRDLENAVDFAHSAALAHALKALANRSRDCRCHALTCGFRQFSGEPMGLLVFYVQAHDLSLYHMYLPFYHKQPYVEWSKFQDSRCVSGGLSKDVLMLAVADDEHAFARAIAHHKFEAVGAGIDSDE